MGANTRKHNTYTLYAIRINRCMSREYVHEMTGISVAMLGRYETGVSMPPATVVQKLCALYEVGIEDIDLEGAKPIITGRGRKKKKVDFNEEMEAAFVVSEKEG